jgi:hypothetical protein
VAKWFQATGKPRFGCVENRNGRPSRNGAGGHCCRPSASPDAASRRAAASALIDRSRLMKFMGYAFRFATDFVLLLITYFSLNYIEKYQQRAILAALILAFAVMHTFSVIRSFNFFNKIERLETETRRLASMIAGGPGEASLRRTVFVEVEDLRRRGEMTSYIDLLFFVLIILLCISKIVTS